MSIPFRGDLEALADTKNPARCAVIFPTDKDTLSGAIISANSYFIKPLILAPKKKIEALAEENHLDLSKCEIEDVQSPLDAAEKAALYAVEGKVECIMKGSIHTDDMMRAILQQKSLRTGRRMSHSYYFNIPAYHKPLLLTDPAVNIEPDLNEKKDIIVNAIELAHILGEKEPKVAILAAVETVTTIQPSTIIAAALCKMADRGQIKGAILDGPLAFDNAISKEAARIKGIKSPVSGEADILVAPNLEAANMLGKQLEYLANAHFAGIVMGVKVPIILTSRADNADSRRCSALLANLVVKHRRENPDRLII